MSFGKRDELHVFACSMYNAKKDAPKAYIQIWDMQLGKDQEPQEADYVEGELVKIKFEILENKQGIKYPGVCLYLKDGKELYIFKAKFNAFTNSMRAILNKLLSATSYKNIKISYFGNEGEYKNVAVYSNDEKLEYMFSKDELAPYIEVNEDKFGNKENNYDALNEFLQIKVTEKIIPLIQKVEDVIDEKIEQEIKAKVEEEIESVKEKPAKESNKNSASVPLVNINNGTVPF